MNFNKLTNTVEICRALFHPTRLKILEFINEKKKTTVTELTTFLQEEQAVVSMHLAILREKRIVQASRKGLFVFYVLNHKRIRQINNALNFFHERYEINPVHYQTIEMPAKFLQVNHVSFKDGETFFFYEKNGKEQSPFITLQNEELMLVEAGDENRS